MEREKVALRQRLIQRDEGDAQRSGLLLHDSRACVVMPRTA